MTAPGALVGDAAGRRRIDFTVDPSNVSENARVVATLYRYDDNAELIQEPLDSYRVAPAKGNGAAQVSVNVVLPGKGLYVLDTKVVSADDADEVPVKVSMAALADGSGTFSDAGVQTHFGHRKGAPATVLSLVKQAGFSWIRDEVFWSEIEKMPGQFQLAHNDHEYGGYIRQAARMNLKPLIELDFGNERAYPALFKGPQGFPQNDEERQLFVRYTEKVVGAYRNYVKTWEVWNEPAFDKISYANYIALLKPVYTAVKKLSPEATVLACGGGGAGGGPGGDCVVQIAKAGALAYQDGFSIHPYMSPYDPDRGYAAKGSPLPRVNVTTVWPHMQRMTQSHPRPGVGPLKVYVTEIGWPSSPHDAGLSERKQAAAAARTFLLSRRFNTMQATFWYDFVDDAVNPADKESNFGLVRLDLSPKPAYVAAATVFKTIGSKMWTHSFVDDDKTKIYQYGGDDGVIVGWSSDADAEPALTPALIPPGRYTQIDWQGSVSTVEVKDGFQWKLGALPKYLVPVKH